LLKYREKRNEEKTRIERIVLKAERVRYNLGSIAGSHLQESTVIENNKREYLTRN